MNFSFIGIDHVQLAAPAGCEDAARAFYAGVLGWPEIAKPESLRRRGGAWFQCGAQQVHVGVQPGLRSGDESPPGLRRPAA